jgi:hypothetical protein
LTLRRVVLLLGLAACNPLFGLQETILVDAKLVDDQDGDGVLDVSDNCPAIANTAQLDIDADLLGDVCDPCSFQFSETFDRDMDGIAPAADNCPDAMNADQLDADGDGVGDDCDPNPSRADRLRCFGDLVTNVGVAWPIADPWKYFSTAGGYIFHQPAAATPFWLGANASGLDPTQLAVRIGIVSPSPPSIDVKLQNGVAVGASDQAAFAACELVAVMTDTSVRLQLSDATGSLGETSLPFTTSHLTLSYRMIASGVELECIAHDSDGARQSLVRTSTAPFDPAVVYFTATNSTAAFRSIVVYENP